MGCAPTERLTLYTSPLLDTPEELDTCLICSIRLAAISLGYRHNGKSQFLVSSSVSFLHYILDIEPVSSLTSRPYQFLIVFKNQCFFMQVALSSKET